MASSNSDLFGVSQAQLQKKRQRRKLTDTLARFGISAGGVSVIAAICLIFFYLLYEVVPLFVPAGVEQQAQLEQWSVTDPWFTVVEEQGQIALSVDRTQGPVFVNAKTGAKVATPGIPDGLEISAVTRDAPGTRRFAMGFNNGEVQILRPVYQIDYSQESRPVKPQMEYPLGEATIPILEGSAIAHLAYRESDKQVRIVAANASNQLFLKEYSKTESFLTGDVELEEQDTIELPHVTGELNELFLTQDQRWLFLLMDNTRVEILDLRQPLAEMRLPPATVATNGNRITSASLLLGGYSLLLGDSKGQIAQWFLAYDEAREPYFANVRTLAMETTSPITAIESEHRRKGFVAANEAGEIGLFNTTASRRVVETTVIDGPIKWVATAPRGNVALVAAATGAPVNLHIENEHPEVSWSSLWGEVWYERYEEPGYTWQSSSASNDFEPKFSLMPLTFGTLKAAFYAMLVAIPLAICGAIYTAYFMAPTLRTKVKPTIELMEALPTVILGFLAGLWLAPLVEANLAGITLILVLTPILCLLTALAFANLPPDIQNRVPAGWVPVMLIPVVIFSGWLSMTLGGPIENTFFDGSMRHWLSNEVGVDYDQRNSLVVGIAMGFAVIPTIFSITEDAIFAVPKGLTQGSLALGATPWQTLVRVVLPTASPGIFSALMIGLGRAVGETMIVLMATGNTPIMDMNIFEGFRTLSANIAVEMPEAEVDSTHYRILFLSGLVLFIFTFFVNTSAEVVRQRLREKYGSL